MSAVFNDAQNGEYYIWNFEKFPHGAFACKKRLLHFDTLKFYSNTFINRCFKQAVYPRQVHKFDMAAQLFKDITRREDALSSTPWNIAYMSGDIVVC